MAIIDVAIPNSQTATTTITAGPGDVINIPAGMMGNITINGGPDVTVNILGDPDSGSTFGQLTLGGFGSDIEPTVNIPAGTDFSRYDIDANGENLTLNVGDGATLGSIDATGMSNTGTLAINAGDDVTIDGSIKNYRADADFTFGSGATVTGTTTATSVGDADVTFGANATFGADISLSDGSTANVNATFGDGLDLTGQIKAGNDGAEMNIAIGNDATITNAINLSTGQAPTNLTIGDNVVMGGVINLASSEDTVVIGDNWDLSNINMGLGDDNITLGMQAEAAGLTQIDGGNSNGYDVDGITIAARPDQVQDFIDAGYIDNGDGTFSAPPAAFNGNPVTASDDPSVDPPNTSVVAVRDFEGAAAPLPNDPPVIDPIADETIPENSTDPVFTATAVDPDGDPVTYSLEGPDAALFEIDADTGEVTPVAPLDFETPTDDNGDGIYDVTVVATDPEGLRDEEPVAITVTNVAEPDGPVDGLEIGETMSPGYVDEQGDEIDGADGIDDIIFGNGGDDIIDAGLGDDTVDGGNNNDTIIGGQGADDLSGGLGSDTFVVDEAGDGTDDVVVGGEDPNDTDIDVLDLTGSNVESIAYTNEDPATESGVVTFADGGTLTFSEIETVIPCFTPGTLIATSKGERLVEELQVGDRVVTRDNGFQEIAWVGEKQLTAREMHGKTDLRPVFVKAGAFGNGLPERDMMLSPNHKVLLADDVTELYFEEREVLVAAKHLVGKAGVHQVDVAKTSYIHFMFERHEVVLSDGVWTESFHPGDYSLNGIDEGARSEILALFPELATDEGLKDYRLARTELKKHEARLLLS